MIEPPDPIGDKVLANTVSTDEFDEYESPFGFWNFNSYGEHEIAGSSPGWLLECLIRTGFQVGVKSSNPDTPRRAYIAIVSREGGRDGGIPQSSGYVGSADLLDAVLLAAEQLMENKETPK